MLPRDEINDEVAFWLEKISDGFKAPEVVARVHRWADLADRQIVAGWDQIYWPPDPMSYEPTELLLTTLREKGLDI